MERSAQDQACDLYIARNVSPNCLPLGCGNLDTLIRGIMKSNFLRMIGIAIAILGNAGAISAEPRLYSDLIDELKPSFAASEILEDYRIWSCEEADEVKGYIPHEDFDPIFMLDDGAYRRVQLTDKGVEAELIYVKQLYCGPHNFSGFCGSGGCNNHLIFDGKDYEIFGGDPFLLLPEPSYHSYGDEKLTGIIAWWGWGGYCHTQEDKETDPVYHGDCLLTAQYDRSTKRLAFQHDFRPFPN